MRSPSDRPERPHSATGRIAAIVAVLLAFIDSPACGGSPNKTGRQSDPTAHGPVYIAGTQEYLRKVEALRITPAKAWKRVRAYVRVNEARGLRLPRYHLLIVGDEYLFSSEWDKTAMWLHGYFVDGHTGKVTARRPFWRVAYGEYPSLRKALELVLRAERASRPRQDAPPRGM
jgi:hypothetical protein